MIKLELNQKVMVKKGNELIGFEWSDKKGNVFHHSVKDFIKKKGLFIGNDLSREIIAAEKKRRKRYNRVVPISDAPGNMIIEMLDREFGCDGKAVENYQKEYTRFIREGK